MRASYIKSNKKQEVKDKILQDKNKAWRTREGWGGFSLSTPNFISNKDWRKSTDY